MLHSLIKEQTVALKKADLKGNMRVKISIKGKLWFLTIGVAFDLTIRQ